MPLQQILPTWLALNGGTFTSPTGLTDIRTGLPFAAGGLNIGEYFDITQQEGMQLSNSAVGTLLAGRYRFVQIDSGATAANVATGTIGMFKSLTSSNYGGPINNVTTYDKALTLNSPRKCVFLCPITAGQTPATGVYGFVQELGDATVLLKSSLTNVSPAIGDVLNITATGLDDPTASGTLVPATVGIAVQTPVAATKIVCQLTAPAFQE
jgi:hypothetical protein